jgi:signal transduction histidine kinase
VLAANAVRHGAGHWQVRIWNTGEALRCEVTNDGPPHAADSTQTTVRDNAAWHLDPGHGLC